jgi:hypothetical protein
MPRLRDVSWASCIVAFRRAGFVQVAESPSNVVLVSAGRTVLLERVEILEETVLEDALRAAGLSGPKFITLLSEGITQVLQPDAAAPAPRL